MTSFLLIYLLDFCKWNSYWIVQCIDLPQGPPRASPIFFPLIFHKNSVKPGISTASSFGEGLSVPWVISLLTVCSSSGCLLPPCLYLFSLSLKKGHFGLRDFLDRKESTRTSESSELTQSCVLIRKSWVQSLHGLSGKFQLWLHDKTNKSLIERRNRPLSRLIW